MESLRSNLTVIEIPDRIAPESLDSFQNKLAAQIREIGGEYALNLENVQNLYSATLALIMHLFKTVQRMKGTMVLINVDTNIGNALEKLKINEAIEVFSTVLDYELDRMGATTLSI